MTMTPEEIQQAIDTAHNVTEDDDGPLWHDDDVYLLARAVLALTEQQPEPVSRGELDDVLRAAKMAADSAFIDHRDGTNSDRVRVALRAAFECAIGNGLIQITDQAGWPPYLSIDPPYTITARPVASPSEEAQRG
jgi:hypothetical protein